MLPSYKPETPSSQMRVHRVAQNIHCETVIVPFNLPVQEKYKILNDVKDSDFVLVQKWRNEFNHAEHISKINGIKILDIDDISEDAEATDLAKACDIIFAANHFLVDWTKSKFPGKKIFMIPTGVDIPENLTPYDSRRRQSIVIAKYGVDRYINHIARIPGWKELEKKHRIVMRIMGTVNPESEELAKNIGPFCKTYGIVPFSKFWEKYGKMLSIATAGIMPLGKAAQGKSGFSVLTMMAAGVPVIASPYGECDHIIENGVNGFLAYKPNDWFAACEKLLSNPELRQKMSLEAIKTIVKKYCIERIVETIEQNLGSI